MRIITKRRILDYDTQEECDGFFRIVPDLKHRRAVLAAKSKTKPVRHLKVV